MPSGEIRLVKETCRATIGSVGNQLTKKQPLVKQVEIAGKVVVQEFAVLR
jgi:ribosomal protein L2